ncbi:MAG: class I SAM-dependent methyltransferase [Saprospiraceae bacterium]|nr:class I SAM-dependent methyltransferase [Saprospiraceae bacterium]
MEDFVRKKHWEIIYQTTNQKDLSWYELQPETSLSFIEKLNLPVTAKIIDMGAGDSLLVDRLVDLGYRDITLLDISEPALKRAKSRLGRRGVGLKWIVADATNYQPTEKYDVWHDRALFHFLTREEEISTYLETAYQSMRPDGILVIGTFSALGPKMCSGMEVRRYSEQELTQRLDKYFVKLECITMDHETPSTILQNFTFCSFRKRI